MNPNYRGRAIRSSNHDMFRHPHTSGHRSWYGETAQIRSAAPRPLLRSPPTRQSFRTPAARPLLRSPSSIRDVTFHAPRYPANRQASKQQFISHPLTQSGHEDPRQLSRQHSNQHLRPHVHRQQVRPSVPNRPDRHHAHIQPTDYRTQQKETQFKEQNRVIHHNQQFSVEQSEHLSYEADYGGYSGGSGNKHSMEENSEIEIESYQVDTRHPSVGEHDDNTVPYIHDAHQSIQFANEYNTAAGEEHQYTYNENLVNEDYDVEKEQYDHEQRNISSNEVGATFYGEQYNDPSLIDNSANVAGPDWGEQVTDQENYAESQYQVNYDKSLNQDSHDESCNQENYDVTLNQECYEETVNQDNYDESLNQDESYSQKYSDEILNRGICEESLNQENCDRTVNEENFYEISNQKNDGHVMKQEIHDEYWNQENYDKSWDQETNDKSSNEFESDQIQNQSHADRNSVSCQPIISHERDASFDLPTQPARGENNLYPQTNDGNNGPEVDASVDIDHLSHRTLLQTPGKRTLLPEPVKIELPLISQHQTPGKNIAIMSENQSPFPAELMPPRFPSTICHDADKMLSYPGERKPIIIRTRPKKRVSADISSHNAPLLPDPFPVQPKRPALLPTPVLHQDPTQTEPIQIEISIDDQEHDKGVNMDSDGGWQPMGDNSETLNTEIVFDHESDLSLQSIPLSRDIKQEVYEYMHVSDAGFNLTPGIAVTKEPSSAPPSQVLKQELKTAVFKPAQTFDYSHGQATIDTNIVNNEKRDDNQDMLEDSQKSNVKPTDRNLSTNLVETSVKNAPQKLENKKNKESKQSESNQKDVNFIAFNKTLLDMKKTLEQIGKVIQFNDQLSLGHTPSNSANSSKMENASTKEVSDGENKKAQDLVTVANSNVSLTSDDPITSLPCSKQDKQQTSDNGNKDDGPTDKEALEGCKSEKTEEASLDEAVDIKTENMDLNEDENLEIEEDNVENIDMKDNNDSEHQEADPGTDDNPTSKDDDKDKASVEPKTGSMNKTVTSPVVSEKTTLVVSEKETVSKADNTQASSEVKKEYKTYKEWKEAKRALQLAMNTDTSGGHAKRNPEKDGKKSFHNTNRNEDRRKSYEDSHSQSRHRSYDRHQKHEGRSQAQWERHSDKRSYNERHGERENQYARSQDRRNSDRDRYHDRRRQPVESDWQTRQSDNKNGIRSDMKEARKEEMTSGPSVRRDSRPEKTDNTAPVKDKKDHDDRHFNAFLEKIKETARKAQSMDSDFAQLFKPRKREKPIPKVQKEKSNKDKEILKQKEQVERDKQESSSVTARQDFDVGNQDAETTTESCIEMADEIVSSTEVERSSSCQSSDVITSIEKPAKEQIIKIDNKKEEIESLVKDVDKLTKKRKRTHHENKTTSDIPMKQEEEKMFSSDSDDDNQGDFFGKFKSLLDKEEKSSSKSKTDNSISSDKRDRTKSIDEKQFEQTSSKVKYGVKHLKKKNNQLYWKTNCLKFPKITITPLEKAEIDNKQKSTQVESAIGLLDKNIVNPQLEIGVLSYMAKEFREKREKGITTDDSSTNDGSPISKKCNSKSKYTDNKELGKKKEHHKLNEEKGLITAYTVLERVDSNATTVSETSISTADELTAEQVKMQEPITNEVINIGEKGDNLAMELGEDDAVDLCSEISDLEDAISDFFGSELTSDDKEMIDLGWKLSEEMKKRRNNENTDTSDDDMGFSTVPKSSTSQQNKSQEQGSSSKSKDDSGQTNPKNVDGGKSSRIRCKRKKRTDSRTLSKSLLNVHGNRSEQSGEEGDVEDNVPLAEIFGVNTTSHKRTDAIGEADEELRIIDVSKDDCNKELSKTDIDTDDESTQEPEEISSAQPIPEVKEEPAHLLLGYTQEPDTVFISDDDHEMIMSFSQPIINLVSSDEDKPIKGKYSGSFGFNPEIKTEESKTVDEIDSGNILPDRDEFDWSDGCSDKGSDFDPNDSMESMDIKTEQLFLDSDYSKENTQSDEDIFASPVEAVQNNALKEGKMKIENSGTLPFSSGDSLNDFSSSDEELFLKQIEAIEKQHRDLQASADIDICDVDESGGKSPDHEGHMPLLKRESLSLTQSYSLTKDSKPVDSFQQQSIRFSGTSDMKTIKRIETNNAESLYEASTQVQHEQEPTNSKLTTNVFDLQTQVSTSKHVGDNEVKTENVFDLQTQVDVTENSQISKELNDFELSGLENSDPDDPQMESYITLSNSGRLNPYKKQAFGIKYCHFKKEKETEGTIDMDDKGKVNIVDEDKTSTDDEVRYDLYGNVIEDSPYNVSTQIIPVPRKNVRFASQINKAHSFLFDSKLSSSSGGEQEDVTTDSHTQTLAGELSRRDDIYNVSTQVDKLTKNISDEMEEASDSNIFGDSDSSTSLFHAATQISTPSKPTLEDGMYFTATQIDTDSAIYNVSHIKQDDLDIRCLTAAQVETDAVLESDLDSDNKQVNMDERYLAATQVDTDALLENDHDTNNDDVSMDERYLTATQIDDVVVSESDQDNNNKQEDIDKRYLAATQVDTGALLESDHDTNNEDTSMDERYLMATQVDEDVVSESDLDNNNKQEDIDKRYLAATQVDTDALLESDHDTNNEDTSMDERYLTATQIDDDAVLESDQDGDKQDIDERYLIATQVDTYAVLQSDLDSSNKQKYVDEIFLNATQIDSSINFVAVSDSNNKKNGKKKMDSMYIDASLDDKNNLQKSCDSTESDGSCIYVPSLEEEGKDPFVDVQENIEHDREPEGKVDMETDVRQQSSANSDETRDEEAPAKKPRLSQGAKRTIFTEPKRLQAVSEKRSGITSGSSAKDKMSSSVIPKRKLYTPEKDHMARCETGPNEAMFDARAVDIWLSKSSTANKTFQPKRSGGKRKRISDHTDMIKARMQAAKSQLNERRMQVACQPTSKHDGKRKRHQSGPTDVDDVGLPSCSQIVNLGLPVLNPTDVLVKKHDASKGNTARGTVSASAPSIPIIASTETLSTSVETGDQRNVAPATSVDENVNPKTKFTSTGNEAKEITEICAVSEPDDDDNDKDKNKLKKDEHTKGSSKTLRNSDVSKLGIDNERHKGDKHKSSDKQNTSYKYKSSDKHNSSDKSICKHKYADTTRSEKPTSKNMDNIRPKDKAKHNRDKDKSNDEHSHKERHKSGDKQLRHSKSSDIQKDKTSDRNRHRSGSVEHKKELSKGNKTSFQTDKSSCNKENTKEMKDKDKSKTSVKFTVSGPDDDNDRGRKRLKKDDHRKNSSGNVSDNHKSNIDNEIRKEETYKSRDKSSDKHKSNDKHSSKSRMNVDNHLLQDNPKVSDNHNTSDNHHDKQGTDKLDDVSKLTDKHNRLKDKSGDKQNKIEHKSGNKDLNEPKYSDRPRGKSSDKTNKSSEKQRDKSNDKHINKSSDKHGDKSSDKHKDKSKDKHGDKATDKSRDKSNDKPRDKSNDKPREKSNDKGKDKSIDKHGNKASDKPRDKSSDKPRDKSSDKGKDKTRNKHGNKASDKHIYIPKVKHGDKVSDKPRDKSSDKPRDKSSDKIKDKSSDKHSNKSSDKYSNKSSDKYKDKSKDKHRDKAIDKPRDNSSDKPRDKSKETLFHDQSKESLVKGSKDEKYYSDITDEETIERSDIEKENNGENLKPSVPMCTDKSSGQSTSSSAKPSDQSSFKHMDNSIVQHRDKSSDKQRHNSWRVEQNKTLPSVTNTDKDRNNDRDDRTTVDRSKESYSVSDTSSNDKTKETLVKGSKEEKYSDITDEGITEKSDVETENNSDNLKPSVPMCTDTSPLQSSTTSAISTLTSRHTASKSNTIINPQQHLPSAVLLQKNPTISHQPLQSTTDQPRPSTSTGGFTSPTAHTRQQLQGKQPLHPQGRQPFQPQGRQSLQPHGRQPLHPHQQGRQPLQSHQQGKQPLHSHQQGRQPLQPHQQGRQPLQSHQQGRRLLQPQPRRQPLQPHQQRRQPLQAHQQGRQPLQSIGNITNLTLGEEQKPPNIVNPKSVLKWDDFLSVILKWNPSWFEESEKHTEPPPVTEDLLGKKTRTLFPLCERYSSFKEYSEDFILPLLLYETWEKCLNSWKEIKNRNRAVSYAMLLESITQYTHSPNTDRIKNMCLLTLHGLVSESERRSYHVNERDIVIIRIFWQLNTPTGREKLRTNWLGYIQSIKFGGVPVDRLCHGNEDLAKMRSARCQSVTVRLIVRARSFINAESSNPDTSKLVCIRVIFDD